MNAALRIFFRSPLRPDEIATAVFAAANRLGINETELNLFDPPVTAVRDAKLRRVSAAESSRENVEREIVSAGGIAGIYNGDKLTGELTLGNAPLVSQHSYCPVCDVRISGANEIAAVEKLADVANGVFESIRWDYGFITNTTVDKGALHYPFGYLLGLPRVFWSNYFGQTYLNLIGASRLDGCGNFVAQVHQGRRITLPCRPGDAGDASPNGLKLIEDVVVTVGAEHFINRKYWRRIPSVFRVVPRLFEPIIRAKRPPYFVVS